ncbi:Gag-pro-like protein [Cucumis melo var. makuwa]|uniref:Gag-pro-like protein n=1 Tax=Cucumis melo var. makuwa TaxID=1194695 RepID=A0A5A7TW53_CUCMM|nr:Gag-pro-like protein [Cucumis melo var. makuwa]TYK02652.1 Gag-pro-like protein [Cucumis melo var. makuwa]
MSYTELLPQLLKSHQVAIVPQEPLQPPYPKWYDPNARCEYHAGTVGHSIENCFPLKAKVQSLVKAGWLKFKKTGEELDVNQNPLPNHEGPAINVVDTFTERNKNMVSGVTTSMNTLFQILHGAGYLSPRFNNDDGEKIGCVNKEECLFYLETNDHSIEDCCEFKNWVQKLMDAKILLVGQISMQEIEVNMITDTSSTKKTSNETTSIWKPLVIHYEEKPSIMSYIQKPKAMTIEIPSPFAYKDNHVVPWKYECQFITNNVVSTTVEGLTRSGRCYTLANLKDVSKEDEVRRRKGKAIEMADEEIFPEGTGHTKALHISVKCKDQYVARVLVDNGLSLNIMSRSTLMKLLIDPSYLRPSTMVVRAFDCARRELSTGTTLDLFSRSSLVFTAPKKVRAEKKAKRSALLMGREMKKERISIPHLSETFKPRELLFDTNQRKRRNEDSEISIAVVSENTIPPYPLVHQCPPGFELNNWEIKKTLEVTKGSFYTPSDYA